MLEIFLANIPIVAAIAGAVAVFLLGGLALGFPATGITLIGFAVVTGALGTAAVMLDRRQKERAEDGLASRQSAEKFQAMLAIVPGGYCLFTPQGLLRESSRMAQVLGVAKVAHSEDLVGAIKEAADFLAAFRKLQQTGQSFRA